MGVRVPLFRVTHNTALLKCKTIFLKTYIRYETYNTVKIYNVLFSE